MIDTFMLKYHLDIRQRRIVYSAVNDLVKEVGMTKFLYADKDYSNARYSLYRTKAFKSEGIKELLIKDCFYPGNRCSFIKLTCKPARVLHRDDEYALSSFEEYEQVVELINSFIMKLNKHMGAYPFPLLDEWAVERIDYAFQFATEEYGLYLMFLRKGCSYKEDKYMDSVYIKSSKCTINFYDKTEERGMEGDSHIMRFEVQCHEDYLYKMLDDERIGSIALRELWDEKLALSIVTKRIGKLVGYGDFYSLEAARSVLQKASRISENEKSALFLLLQMSSYPSIRRESQWDLFAVRNGNTDRGGKIRGRMERILKRFGMNQFAIPVRRHVDRLKNPAQVIMEITGNV